MANQNGQSSISTSLQASSLCAGAMHAHHPGLLQLQPFVAQERSRAEEQMSVSQVSAAPFPLELGLS
eukprot:1160180-Pelagomonas_calceolata.AAC.8